MMSCAIARLVYSINRALYPIRKPRVPEKFRAHSRRSEQLASYRGLVFSAFRSPILRCDRLVVRYVRSIDWGAIFFVKGRLVITGSSCLKDWKTRQVQQLTGTLFRYYYWFRTWSSMQYTSEIRNCAVYLEFALYAMHIYQSATTVWRFSLCLCLAEGLGQHSNGKFSYFTLVLIWKH